MINAKCTSFLIIHLEALSCKFSDGLPIGVCGLVYVDDFTRLAESEEKYMWFSSKGLKEYIVKFL